MEGVGTDPHVTLGIFAGGAASRLGGRDKAWLVRDGQPQVAWLVAALSARPGIDAVIVSANRNAEQYLSHGLRAVHDTTAGIGPLGGLQALLDACRGHWLLTAPVDLVQLPDNLLHDLQGVGAPGAFVVDDDGPQPLLALWPVAAARLAMVEALDRKDHAVHALQSRLGMHALRVPGMRIGNLNTPADLVAAGIDPA